MKFTKRMLSIFVALIMMISIAIVAIPASADGATISLGEVDCLANGDVVVPLSIENNAGVWGINLQVEYNKNLTYKSIEKVNSDIGNCMATATDNVITFLIESSSERNDISDDGVLANITFSTEAWAEGKNFDVKFTYIDRKSITNAQGEDLVSAVTLKDGVVKCVTESVGPEVPVETTTQPVVKECVHASTTVANKVNATYFAAGFTGDVVCASCGEVIKAGKTVAKLKFKKPSVTVKGAKKQLKVTYKKVAGANGFQVRYRIKGAWKVVNYNNVKKSVTKTIKKLKKGNYKVQLRVFVKNGKKTVYSAWSKVAKATVK